MLVSSWIQAVTTTSPTTPHTTTSMTPFGSSMVSTWTQANTTPSPATRHTRTRTASILNRIPPIILSSAMWHTTTLIPGSTWTQANTAPSLTTRRTIMVKASTMASISRQVTIAISPTTRLTTTPCTASISPQVTIQRL